MRNSLVTRLYTRRYGIYVGEDQFGNQYYRNPKAHRAPGLLSSSEKRWVLYNGAPEASRVPPAWHAWLHHITDEPPTSGEMPDRQPWEKEHTPNRTMTAEAYRPPGHTLRGGKRAKGTGDYEPWLPS